MNLVLGEVGFFVVLEVVVLDSLGRKNDVSSHGELGVCSGSSHFWFWEGEMKGWEVWSERWHGWFGCVGALRGEEVERKD